MKLPQFIMDPLVRREARFAEVPTDRYQTPSLAPEAFGPDARTHTRPTRIAENSGREPYVTAAESHTHETGGVSGLDSRSRPRRADLEKALFELRAHEQPCEKWAPRLFVGKNPVDRRELAALIAAGHVSFLHDTIHEQLMELIETRCPAEHLSDAELRKRAAAHRAEALTSEYGTWAYYPWSRRLVHVLPEAEYRELRTSRNRNKITADEQDTLRSLSIGIVGLSVGQASAVTLAMEEVGGSLYLADFDRLSLSNLNRLRAGAHAIGTHKAVLAAREIFELNPYADVHVFTDGITDDNLESFLCPDGPLDVLVEECDDFYVKIRLREAARALGIPVVMETSDRGMIDIERFDLEPERPLFHGLIEGMNAESFKALSTLEKVPLGLQIIGGEQVSPRLAASAVEVNETLKTWPQLASAVTLGSAVNTDVIRRMALGQLNGSGRFYVDLDRVVADGMAVPVELANRHRSVSAEAVAEPKMPEVRRARTAALDEEQVRTLVSYAIMAPSGGNAQPWRFVYGEETLDVHLVPERSESLLDYKHLASYLALGAVAENIDLVAEQLGLKTGVETFPAGENATLVLSIRFSQLPDHGAEKDTLFDQIGNRITNRRLGERVALAEGDAAHLEHMAHLRRAKLQLLTGEDDLAAIADIVGAGDRMRFVSKQMHSELVEEIRWNPKQVEHTRDGLDVATLELSSVDLAGLRLASSMGVMDLVGKVGGGRSLEKPSRRAIAAASGVGLLTIGGGHKKAAMVEGGRALQRVWLSATARGYAFQPMTALVCLFWRLLDGAEGLSRGEVKTLANLRARYLELFPVAADDAEVMLFRLARADAASAHSLRRRVQDVLEFR